MKCPADRPCQVIANTDQEVIDWIECFRKGQVGTGNPKYIFRGQTTCNTDHILRCTIQRPSGNRARNKEREIFKEIQDYIGTSKVANTFGPEEAGKWLARMQHNGIPTRLLDWTSNPHVALYFALADQDGRLKFSTDGVVAVVNVQRLFEKVTDYRGKQPRFFKTFLPNTPYENGISPPFLYLSTDWYFELLNWKERPLVLPVKPGTANYREHVQSGYYTVSAGDLSVSQEELLRELLPNPSDFQKIHIPPGIKPRLFTRLAETDPEINAKFLFEPFEEARRFLISKRLLER